MLGSNTGLLDVAEITPEWLFLDNRRDFVDFEAESKCNIKKRLITR